MYVHLWFLFFPTCVLSYSWLGADTPTLLSVPKNVAISTKYSLSWNSVADSHKAFIINCRNILISGCILCHNIIVSPRTFFYPNLPGPQNTIKWTIHTWNIDVRPSTFNFHDLFWGIFSNSTNTENTQNASLAPLASLVPGSVVWSVGQSHF